MINDFKHILSCIKWRNIPYDFNVDNTSENCLLNVFVGSQVNLFTINSVNIIE